MYNDLPTNRMDSKAMTGAAAAVLLLTFGAVFGSAATAGTPRGSAELGAESVGAAIAVDLAALPQASHASATEVLPPPPPHTGVDPVEYQKRKDEAAKSTSALFQQAPNGDIGPAPKGIVPGQQTPGATPVFPGLQQVGGIAPSDMALAVNGSWVVQVVNSQIAVSSKTGVVQPGFPKRLGGAGGFFSGATSDIGDPRAFYDTNAGRFVVVADDFTGGRMWLAASRTADPRGLWNIYSFNPWGAGNCRAAGQACPDFPMIGFDDTTIYMSLNLFPAAGGVSDWMLLLPKAQIYAGAGFGFNFWFNLTFNGVLVDTVQPVTILTSSAHSRAGFAINSFNINYGGGQCSRAPCNGLAVWAFSNNLQVAGSPGPELSAVFVATANNYRLPANANQRGTATTVDTGDVRISATPTFHAGVITAALTTNGADARAHVLWFQVLPFLNDNNPRCTGAFLNRCPRISGAKILNEDCFFCGGQGAAGSSYFGALQPNVAGDLTMVYVFSDTNTNPESAYASRRVTQTPNTLHDAGFVLCGNAASPWLGGRWGDYSAVAGDISIAKQHYMWFSAMNGTAGGRWGACIGRNGFTAINQP